MRELLKSSKRWLRVGWFWPLALLTLPMCTFDFDSVGPQPPTHAFDPGPEPTSAVMCDIPKVVIEEDSDCATEEDLDQYPSMSGAALALNLGETLGNTVLDYSSIATMCNGQPRKVQFHGPFPEGLAVCLDCNAQIPAVYPGPTDVCIAQCKDLINFGDGPIPAEGVDMFCTNNARPSTNFDKDTCFENFCTNVAPIPDADDPRRQPEAVTWTDFVNITPTTGNTLEFDGPDPMTGLFSAGAASAELIMKGDAWVEFEAGENGVSHAVGVRSSCDNVVTCPDEDPTLVGLPLLLSLNVDDNVNIILNGERIAGPFPEYTAGERFRIQVRDRHDTTADILFFRYATPCVPNIPCTEPPFFIYDGAARPNYPLRVDAIFREVGATLQNVTIMRIK